MVKTFNVDRTKGGTFSFKLDAQGNYGLHKDGFDKVKTLNLPELKKEDTKTTTITKDTKTASAQTKEAFGDVQPFYYRGGGADQQYTQQYDMVKDKSLDTDINQTSFKPNMLDVSGEVQPMTKDTVYQDAIMRGEKGIKAEAPKINEKSIRVNKQGTEFPRPEAGTIDQMAANRDPNRFLPMSGPQKQSQLGVRVPDRISSTLRPSIEKAKVSETALKQINTASNTLSKTLGEFIKGGGIVGGIVRSISGPPTATQTHAKGYFNVTGGNVDGGRIAGNPATDLYAGMNRVSSFGNLEKAGAKRIFY